MDWKLIIAYLAGVFVILLIAKIFFAPVKIILKLFINCLLGGLAIFILNFIGSTIGIEIPLNLVTAFIAGVMGIPGILLIILIMFFF